MKKTIKTAVLMLLVAAMSFSTAAPAAHALYILKAPSPVTGKSAETAIYNYMHDVMGLNEAACCGVLANIQAESGFNPNAGGDEEEGVATSYGICQWHYGRWDRLKDYCNSNGLSWETLDGQLKYLDYELRNYYSSTLSRLRGVDNTADGAYDAGYYWCYYFENPSNKEAKSAQRGSTAASVYWPVYAPEDADSGVEFTETDAYGYYKVTSSTGAVIRSSPTGGEDNKSGTADANAVYYMEALCTNAEGDQYYRINSGKWAGYYISATVVAAAEGVSDEISAKDISYPTRLIVGDAFTVSGSLSSQISGLKSVSVMIYDAAGEYTGVGKSVTINRMEYNLASLDSYIKFGKLTDPGMYTYKVEAKNAGSTYVFEKQFEVVPIASVTVTFDANGGSCDTQTKTVSSMKPYGKLPVPTRDDLVFVGWYTKASGGSQITESSTVDVEDSITLYAHWSLPAPTDAKATPNDDGSITLTWSGSAKDEGYTVYYKAEGYSSWNEYKSLTEKSCTLTGLTNATRYELSVKAYWIVNGEKQHSNERSAIVKAVSLTAPGTPTGLGAEHIKGGVRVAWGKVSSAAGYTLQYSSDGTDWTTKDNITATEYVLTELDDTLTYSFRVRAYSSCYDQTRYGSYSTSVSMGPKAVAKSPASIAASSDDEGAVSLSWNTVSGADGYQVYYRQSGASEWSKGPWVDSGAAKVTGLSDKTVYEFRVQSVTYINAEGTSADDYSAVATCAVFKAPAAPEGLWAERNDDGSITVGWSAVDGAVKYTVAYKADGGSWKYKEGITTTSCSLSNVKEGSEYTVKVCAYGSFGGTTKAGEYSGSTTAPAKETAPPPSSARASSNDDGSVTVSWNRVSGADGYGVYYRSIIYKGDEIDDYGEWECFNTTTGISLKVTGLAELTNYQFRVNSYTMVDGNKAYSNDYSDRCTAPSITVPDAPGGVYAEPLADGSVHVLWAGVENASGYTLFYSQGGSGWKEIENISDTEYTVSGLKLGAEYSFRVSAVRSFKGVEKSSAKSAGVSIKPVELGEENLPGAPEDISVVTNSDGSLTVSWSKVTGAEGYRVYCRKIDDRIVDESGEVEKYICTSFVMTDTDSAECTLTGLEAPAAYEITVRAVASAGESTVVSVYAGPKQAAAAMRQPAAPVGLTAKRDDNGNITAQWTSTVGASYYELQYSVDGVNWTTEDRIGEQSFVIEGVAEDARCHIRLRGISECLGMISAGPYSAIFTVRSINDPTADMTAEPNPDGSISLSWDAAEGADGYRVYYCPIINTSGMLDDEVLWLMSEYTEDTQMTLDGLDHLCAYQIKVYAYIDVNGIKSHIETYSTYTRAPSITAPAAPSGVKAVWTDHGTLAINWDEQPGINRVVIEYSVDGEVWQKAVVLAGGGFELSGLETGASYQVRVSAGCSCLGVTMMSDAVTVYSELPK